MVLLDKIQLSVVMFVFLDRIHIKHSSTNVLALGLVVLYKADEKFCGQMAHNFLSVEVQVVPSVPPCEAP